MGTDESFQVLFGDLPKNQTSWVWGEITACRVRGLKDVSACEFPERMDMLVICILANSLNGSWFKNTMVGVREYFEKQGKEINVAVILATNTHISPYALTRMLAYNPDFQQLHALGRFQAYERGAPLHPLLAKMYDKPTLAKGYISTWRFTNSLAVITFVCLLGGFVWSQYHSHHRFLSFGAIYYYC